MQGRGDERWTQERREAPVVYMGAQCSWQLVLTLRTGRMGTAMAGGSRDDTNKIANTLPRGSCSPDRLIIR